MSDDYDVVNPGAAAMIESLRAYGYSLNTAIADLIDNSISAGASNIWVRMHWGGDVSWISITDDGSGMDEPTLKNAMRPGSQNPLDDRSDDDLGRFGLGLKTASFSQCRSLTVASKTSGQNTFIRRWDLDYVGKHDEWRLLKDARKQSGKKLTHLDEMDHGTAVLLEDLDRLCDGQKEKDVAHRKKFFARIDSLERHLSMVFHRFMEGRNSLNIFINGRGDDHKLQPWDPFVVTAVATQKQPSSQQVFHDGVVFVEGYVLPHKDKFDATSDHEAAAGPGGWNDQQGFYVYRSKRLLVAGSWLGLGGKRHGWTKEEHYKLTRIKVDIPNNMDSAWQIDVKKSAAVPPPLVQGWLEDYAKQVRQKAREAFSHRGQIGSRPIGTEVTRLWKAGSRGGATVYRVDRTSDLVKKILSNAGDTKPDIESLLKILEETVPVQQIWLDMAEKPENNNEPMGGLSETEVLKLVETTLTALVGKDRKATQSTIDYICTMDCFINFEDLIRAKYLGVDA